MEEFLKENPNSLVALARDPDFSILSLFQAFDEHDDKKFPTFELFDKSRGRHPHIMQQTTVFDRVAPTTAKESFTSLLVLFVACLFNLETTTSFVKRIHEFFRNVANATDKPGEEPRLSFRSFITEIVPHCSLIVRGGIRFVTALQKRVGIVGNFSNEEQLLKEFLPRCQLFLTGEVPHGAAKFPRKLLTKPLKLPPLDYIRKMKVDEKLVLQKQRDKDLLEYFKKLSAEDDDDDDDDDDD